jgi:hypothetical protein
MTVLIEGFSETTSEATFEKYTTKAVCKSLGCKGSILRDAMKYINLKIVKDEFGNRWFTKEDIENIREFMRNRKTDMLLKILSKELEKESSGEPLKEPRIYSIKNETQTCVGQLVEQVKVEMNNTLTKHIETIKEEMQHLNSQNEVYRNNSEKQLELEVQNMLTKQTEVIKNEFKIEYKQSEELKKAIEEKFKLEIQRTISNQTEFIEQGISVIKEQGEEFKKTIVEQFKEELQSIISMQTEAVKNEISTLHKHNEELKKRVEELTRMIQTTQEGHFKAVDERLHQLIESSKKRGLFRSK